MMTSSSSNPKEYDMSTVLITGASRGIGLETALAFGRAGHRVCATMRNPANAPELAARVAADRLTILISAMDVDSDASVRDAIAAIETIHGSIDVLVNNAGIEASGSVEELPLATFRSVMETNYFGALRCIKAVLPQMRQRRSGCIVNVSSVAGKIACSPLTAYMASKFALEAASECLAGEMKPFNVRVAIVEPGIIDTAMAHRIEDPGEESPYSQRARFSQLFVASLRNPVPPSIVAGKILEVAESGTWTLRHPVGPDASPFLQWRAHFSDEDWVNLNASDDDAWYGRIHEDFGLDARPHPVTSWRRAGESTQPYDGRPRAALLDRRFIYR
jgi:NAD(P)-dependent dehydrogenase (short-subunit alcohol dehydrogenase family)